MTVQSVQWMDGCYGRGWCNVDFKYGWCHCIRQTSANQLCAWEVQKRETGNTFMLNSSNSVMPIFLSGSFIASVSNYTPYPFITTSLYPLWKSFVFQAVFILRHPLSSVPTVYIASCFLGQHPNAREAHYRMIWYASYRQQFYAPQKYTIDWQVFSNLTLACCQLTVRSLYFISVKLHSAHILEK